MPNKIYIHEDTGTAHIMRDGVVFFAPLNIKNTLLTLDDFSEVEYDLVGHEIVKHEGFAMTINELGTIIRKILA